jgi:hypothetical protein
MNVVSRPCCRPRERASLWDNRALMPRLSTGLLVAGGLATLLTLVIAWPVVLHPTQLIYGREIVGRHPDTYSVIQQFGEADSPGASPELLTDLPGWLLGRVLHPVAAFNLLLLLSFPMAAMAAYALARYIARSHLAGLVAGLAFAFSPARLAHAAYHPHLTQIGWLPLYFLALVALVNRRSLPHVLGLAAAAIGLAFSSLYGALFAAVMSPIVVVAFWTVRSDADRNLRPLVWPALAVAVIAASYAGYAWVVRPDFYAGVRPDAISIGDVAFYRARWWAYLIPAVDHPVLGRFSERVFGSGGINLQLAEQQLYLGYGLLLLAAAALVFAIARWFSDVEGRVIGAVLVVGLIAIGVSLGPTSGSCEPASMAPGCLIFRVAPLFRAYARFGLVAQLMSAVAAGAGAAFLFAHSAAGRRTAIALLALAVFEYWPLPARAHDVLPTAAHRWLAEQPSAGPVLDCYPGSDTERAIAWLMQRQVSFLDSSIRSCANPELGVELAGLGYTQVLVRRSPAASKLPFPLPPGISTARAFPDSEVYTIAATPPPVITLSTSGFFAYERDGDDWWRWMGPRGQWIVRNTTSAERRVFLKVNLVSIGAPRRLTLMLDGKPAGAFDAGMERRDHVAGPWMLSPGDHTLTFEADGDSIQPSQGDGSRDTRELTVAFRNDRWTDMP